jgi:hypothetical protein
MCFHIDTLWNEDVIAITQSPLSPSRNDKNRVGEALSFGMVGAALRSVWVKPDSLPLLILKEAETTVALRTCSLKDSL